MKHEFDILKQEERRFRIALKESKEAVVRHERGARDLRVAMQRADSTVEDLQDALDRDAVEEGRLDVFKINLEEAEDDKKYQESQYEEAVIARDHHMEAMKTRLDKIGSLNIRITEVNAKMENLKSKALELSDQRQAALQKKNASIQLLDETKKHKKILESDRIARVETVTSYIDQANAVGARISIEQGETATTIEKKLEKLIADNERYEARLVWFCD